MLRSLALSLLLGATLAAHAAPPTTESIDSLLVITKTEQLVESMAGQFEPLTQQVIEQSIAGKALTAEQRRRMETLPAELNKVFKEEMNWAKLRAIHLKLYQDIFTQEEVDGLIAFYRSPVGLAFIEKMPLVTQKSIEMMQAMMPAMIKRLEAATAKAMSESR